jgi:hypothetical protein
MRDPFPSPERGAGPAEPIAHQKAHPSPTTNYSRHPNKLPHNRRSVVLLLSFSWTTAPFEPLSVECANQRRVGEQKIVGSES